jgi:hypothetical protein
MGGVSSMHGRGDIHTRRFRYGWEDNVKIDFKDTR